MTSALRPLWICPICGKGFGTRDLSHACVRVSGEMEGVTLMEGAPTASRAAAFEDAVAQHDPGLLRNEAP